MSDTRSIKADYPTYLDKVQYAPFKTWDISYKDSVMTHETEAGTQEDSITRKGRRSISVATTCLDTIARQLGALKNKDYFEVKYYDVDTDDYVIIDMRIQPSSFSRSLKERTASNEYSMGVYNISFVLEEF